jgi:hypothetical protein
MNFVTVFWDGFPPAAETRQAVISQVKSLADLEAMLKGEDEKED